MAPKPRLQALLLADQVYTDHGTGKRIIAGTFNAVASTAFPLEVHERPFVFFSITDVRKGRATLVLRFVDVSDLSVLRSTNAIELVAETPQETVEGAVRFPRFSIPHPGIYDVEAHVDDEKLGSVRLTVRQLEEGSQ